MVSTFSTFAIVKLVFLSSTFVCAETETNSTRSLARSHSNRERIKNSKNCDSLLTAVEIQEIANYQSIASIIIDEVINGTFKGKTYKEIADFVDLHPLRQSGFGELESAIDYMMDRMREFGIENVRGEEVLIPHWIRGEEVAEMRLPHRRSLNILGLGGSVGTLEEGITADAIVVKSFDDLESKKDQVGGKIVVFNQGWLGNYRETSSYRSYGASRSAQHGAVAALIESITPFSLYTPHTGGLTYTDDVPHIPVACITGEDAEFLWRLQERNQSIKIHLKMLDKNMPMKTSRNLIGELPGKHYKDQYVVVSGHIDSWDTSQGAMDDAGGVMISVMALAVLKKLNLQPRRTLQAILWTGEEMGHWGVDEFRKKHKDHLTNFSAILESDLGTFKPKGLDFAGSEKAGCIISEMLKLTAIINTTEYSRYVDVGSDVAWLEQEGLPGISLNTENERYFWYHHSKADTISMMDSDDLDLNTALWAVSAYVLSDIENKLPRDPPSK